jgi:DNA modification methylase
VIEPANIVAVDQGYVCLGDCLDLLPLLDAGSVDLVLADLPYAVTQHVNDVRIDLSKLWPLLLRAAKPEAAFVFTTQGTFTFEVYASQPNLFRYDLVWDKMLSTGHLNAKKMPLRAHENVLVFSRKPPTYNPQLVEGTPNHGWKKRSASGGANYGASQRAEFVSSNMKHPTSILRFQKPHAAVAAHRTEKPIELGAWIINTYTNANALVVDPTCGSGTTAVAARAAGRRFIVMDKDPECFAAVKSRMAA